MAGTLLFDENLSPRLVSATADDFHGSIHNRDAGLKGATDLEIWSFEQQRAYTIVTKDDVFRGLSLLRGAPPKVFWVIVGNTSTHNIYRIIQAGQCGDQQLVALLLREEDQIAVGDS